MVGRTKPVHQVREQGLFCYERHYLQFLGQRNQGCTLEKNIDDRSEEQKKQNSDKRGFPLGKAMKKKDGEPFSISQRWENLHNVDDDTEVKQFKAFASQTSRANQVSPIKASNTTLCTPLMLYKS